MVTISFQYATAGPVISAAVQALPGAQQQRMAAARPQQISRGLLQAGRARAQARGRQALCSSAGHTSTSASAAARAARSSIAGGIAARTAAWTTALHPDHRQGARLVDGQQARPLQDQQRAQGTRWVHGARGAIARGVVARRLRGEQRAGDPVAVQQRGQRQQRLGRTAGRQPVGLLEGERSR